MMRPVISKDWWRVEEGVVIFEKGWARDDDPDNFFFGMPEGTLFEGWEDVESFHVDVLFETETPAKEAAIAWLDAKIKEYQIRLALLHGTNMT